MKPYDSNPSLLTINATFIRKLLSLTLEMSWFVNEIFFCNCVLSFIFLQKRWFDTILSYFSKKENFWWKSHKMLSCSASLWLLWWVQKPRKLYYYIFFLVWCPHLSILTFRSYHIKSYHHSSRQKNIITEH